MSEVFEGKNMRKTFVEPALVEENSWCIFIAQQHKWAPQDANTCSLARKKPIGVVLLNNLAVSIMLKQM